MPLPIRNSATKYGLVARLLHWTSVALLITLILTADSFADLDRGEGKTALIRQHASWGMVFLMVMLLRVYWRCTNPDPVVRYTIQGWQKFAARFLHLSIYTVVILQSLIGLINLASAGAGIPFFGFFETAALMQENREVHRISTSLHYVLSVVIYPLFAIHIGAAIYHQLFGVPDE